MHDCSFFNEAEQSVHEQGAEPVPLRAAGPINIKPATLGGLLRDNTDASSASDGDCFFL